MVLMFTDIVGSVDLKKKYGNEEAGRLIAEHDRLFREVIESVNNAEILKDTGDGFLARFSTTSEAVIASLRFQYALYEVGIETHHPIEVRIGIHLGEVSELDLETTGIAKVSGLAVDLAARVMGLALPGQTLLTRAACDNARQYVREHPVVSDDENEPLPKLRWMAHGRYLFQGHDEALEIFEVGAEGIAPLRVPPSAGKARRAVGIDDEETLGWRPAIGLTIPGRDGWLLERRLGEGGFGEVWLGTNRRTGSHRVFKFCYDADRLRSFKRELTLLKVLRDALGDRDDIARLYEVRLDEPPFYLESEFTEHGSLLDWTAAIGGIDKVDLDTRIELVAATADAVAAAHSVGVLHKDVKPANILIFYGPDQKPRPRLADFGIGTLDKEKLAEQNLIGFTSSIDTGEPTHTGTVIYSPPETLAGQPFTMQGDVYALGVLLYQMMVGDLNAPVVQGWERDVPDPLICEDIAACVEGHEAERLASARELAERLRTLPQRRRVAARRRYTRFGSVAAAILLLAALLSAGLTVRERTLRSRAEDSLARMQVGLEFVVNRIIDAADPTKRRVGTLAGPDITMASVLDQMMIDAEDEKAFEKYPDLKAEILGAIGTSYKNLSIFDKAETAMRRSLEIREELFEDQHPLVAESMKNLADVLWHTRRYTDALPLYRESLEIQEKLSGGNSADVATHLNGVAACLASMGRLKDAEDAYTRALEMRRALYQDDPESIDPLLIAASENNLATCLRQQERYSEAEERFRASIAQAQKAGGEGHVYVGQGHHNIAMLFRRQNRFDDAEVEFAKALELKKNGYPRFHASIANTELEYARNFFDQDDFEQAKVHAAEAVEIFRVVDEARPLVIANALRLLGEVQQAAGDADEAAETLTEVLDINKAEFVKAVGSEREQSLRERVAIAESQLGEVFCDLSDYEKAEPLLVSAHDTMLELRGSDDALTHATRTRLITLYEATDRTAMADALR